MRDPQPSNITGQKKYSHNIKWEVNVGYVMIGLAVIYVAYRLDLGSIGDGEENGGVPVE